MTLNLHGRGTRPEAFQALVEQWKPDMILLTELPEDGTPLMEPLANRYPHRLAERNGSPFDVVLLSRWRIEQRSIDRSAAAFLPVLSVLACDPHRAGLCLTLVGLHAARPLGQNLRLQEAQLRIAAAAAQAAPKGDVVVMGDLNLTPWSWGFRRFAEQAGVRDNPQERGLSATWLSRFPLAGLMIDHVLTGTGIRMLRSDVGPDVGSDHLPVVADLALSD